MRTLVGLVLLAAAPGFAAAQVSKEDLKKLSKAGLSDDVILAYVKTYGFQGRLTADDLVELKDSGIGDRVLEGLLAPAAEAPPAAESKAPAERPAYPSGTWSVSIPKVYPSSYYHPVYRPYYTGSIARPYYGYYRPYYRGYYRPYYGSYGGPRYYGYARCTGRVCY